MPLQSDIRIGRGGWLLVNTWVFYPALLCQMQKLYEDTMKGPPQYKPSSQLQNMYRIEVHVFQHS